MDTIWRLAHVWHFGQSLSVMIYTFEPYLKWRLISWHFSQSFQHRAKLTNSLLRVIRTWEILRNVCAAWSQSFTLYIVCFLHRQFPRCVIRCFIPKMWNNLRHNGAVISSLCCCKLCLLSSEYVILVYQSNNNFIFILFLHVFDVFSSYQPFVDSHESSLFGVQTSSLNHQLNRTCLKWTPTPV